MDERALLRETGADAVYWNRRYEPDAIAADRHCKETLRRDGVQVHSSNASLLLEPWENGKEDGTPYRVFTPFWKAMLKRGAMPAPVPVPTDLPGPAEWPACDGIEALGLLDGELHLLQGDDREALVLESRDDRAGLVLLDGVGLDDRKRTLTCHGF